MSQLKKAYLLKDGEVEIQFFGDPPTMCSNPTVLFTPNLKKFKAFPNETYDEDQIAALTEALKEAANFREEQKPKIEMYGKYDEFYEVPRMFTEVKFPLQFVKKLKNVLADAKISIRGTYNVLKKRDGVFPSAHSTRHGPLPYVDPYSYSVPQLISQESLTGVERHRVDFDATYSSVLTSVDNHVEQFNVEGIQLKEHATYETFNGIGNMNALYKSQGLKRAQLNYSIIIEWQDFGMDAEECERNVLDKLLQDKELVDCTIVGAKAKQFPCHRIILAVHSDVLRANLGSGMKESKTRRILMKDVCPEAVELMLDFMYCRKLELVGKTGEVVLDLLKVAHKYNIGQLEKLTTHFLSRQPSDWFSMNDVLELYFFTVKVDSLQKLAGKFWSIMRSNTQQLSASTAYQDWMRQEPNAAARFALQLMQHDSTFKREGEEVAPSTREVCTSTGNAI